MGGSLKAFYTIPELAELAGVERTKMRRVLEAQGVEMRRQGRNLVITLSALKRAFPDLWDSIQDRIALET